MSQEYLNIIACPECSGRLQGLEISGRLSGFVCEKCLLIYPVKDGIFILLPKEIRNYSLEYGLVEDLVSLMPGPLRDKLSVCIENTLRYIKTSKDSKSWEWEDEKYWKDDYECQASGQIKKNWNGRIWQREFLVDTVRRQASFAGKTILDVGCGTGFSFRHLISSHCDDSALYVATDISLEGLKLNRMQNTHKNALYILCSADKLPLGKSSVDILCYFGILHHTKGKTDIINRDSRLIKSGGYLLLHEALDRQSFSSFMPEFMRPRRRLSAHEERINKKELLRQFKASNLLVLKEKEMSTAFFNLIENIFGKLIVKSRLLFSGICKLDAVFLRCFGIWKPFFEPGEILLIAKKC